MSAHAGKPAPSLLTSDQYGQLELELASALLQRATGALPDKTIENMTRDIDYAEPSVAILWAILAAREGQWAIPEPLLGSVRTWAEYGGDDFREAADTLFAALDQPPVDPKGPSRDA